MRHAINIVESQMERRGAAVAGSGDSVEFSRALLARLGLPADASPDQAQAARDRLVAFLDSAPPELRAWARQQASAADAALALLAEPGAVPTDQPDDEVAGESDASDFDEDYFDEDDFDQDGPGPVGSSRSPSRPRGDRPAPASRQRSGQRVTGNRAGLRLKPTSPQARRRLSRLVPIALVLVVAAVVYGVYQAGAAPTEPASPHGSEMSATRPLDEARVAELMGKLEANPADVDTLRALADVYFQAGDYPTAASWHQKIIDSHPDDITARLSLGVALFNSNDLAGAEQQWLKAVELDPNQAEAHYDLGFLYLSKSPPDMAKARAEWTRVIEIDPNSDLAKTVSTHIDSLESELASPSASSSPASGG